MVRSLHYHVNASALPLVVAVQLPNLDGDQLSTLNTGQAITDFGSEDSKNGINVSSGYACFR